MHRDLRSVAALIASLLVASSASAQTWPDLGSPVSVERDRGDDVALIVAVEDYAFLPDIPGARRNAADWEQFLTESLGVEEVLLLADSQAVREQILEFAARTARSTSRNSTVWVVFIGHGAPASDGKEGVLVGADGQQNPASLAARGVRRTELLAALNQGKQRNTVLLLDACFSGRDAGGRTLARGTMPVLPIRDAAKLPRNTVVLTAAQPDQFAGDLPGADRPAFSYLVLGAMRGWARGDDDVVTAKEAVKFARRELFKIPGRQQTPQLVGANLSLTRGVSEDRPTERATPEPHRDRPPDRRAASTPDAQARSTHDAQKKRALPAKADHVADDTMFYSLAGIVAFNGGAAIGYGAELAVGVKLPLEPGYEVRFGARPAFRLVPDPDEVPDVDSSFSRESQTSDLMPVGSLGVLLEYAKRSERDGQKDGVVAGGAVGGFASGASCKSVRRDGVDTPCNEQEDFFSPLLGLRLTYKSSVLQTVIGYDYIFDYGWEGGIGFGLSWDD